MKFAAVKHVHASGILHCDIKPENFMFGLGENAGRVYLIDFNLWTAWRSFDTPDHLVDGEEGTAAEGFRGTYRYASINCHLDGALSRRDDLESLAYSIFALYAGGLPWSGRKDCKEILQSKQIWQQWGGLQGFTEEPDYDGWREAFWRVDNDTADFSLSESDPLYDPADTATEKVPRNMDFVNWEGLQDKFFTVYYPATKNAGRMEYAAGSSHGYFPASSGWDFPLTMMPEDTIDGGQDLIRDFVEHISQPPTTEHPSLSSRCPPEIMRDFDDPIPYKIYIEEARRGLNRR
uniref:non-specific serine/threonine protein kinase n=1 Tax=Ganoderma boninense TaxID=34458 RepID=A0A5K1JT58_9APHY|nr:N/A [Ganoderma boninense]